LPSGSQAPASLPSSEASFPVQPGLGAPHPSAARSRREPHRGGGGLCSWLPCSSVGISAGALRPVSTPDAGAPARHSHAGAWERDLASQNAAASRVAAASQRGRRPLPRATFILRGGWGSCRGRQPRCQAAVIRGARGICAGLSRLKPLPRGRGRTFTARRGARGGRAKAAGSRSGAGARRTWCSRAPGSGRGRGRGCRCRGRRGA